MEAEQKYNSKLSQTSLFTLSVFIQVIVKHKAMINSTGNLAKTMWKVIPYAPLRSCILSKFWFANNRLNYQSLISKTDLNRKNKNVVCLDCGENANIWIFSDNEDDNYTNSIL